MAQYDPDLDKVVTEDKFHICSHTTQLQGVFNVQFIFTLTNHLTQPICSVYMCLMKQYNFERTCHKQIVKNGRPKKLYEDSFIRQYFN